MNAGQIKSVLMLIPAAALAIWSWSFLASARSAAQAALIEERQSRDLADQIISLRTNHGPTTSPSRTADLAGQIDRALKSSATPASDVLRIDPEPPQPVGDGPYLQKPATLQLRNLRARQALTFLHALGSSASTLRLKSIHLTAPQDSSVDQWSLECVVIDLIPAPRPETTASFAE